MTIKECLKLIEKYNKETPFLKYLEGFCYKLNNTFMFILSACASLMGVSQLPNYNTPTLEFLLCLITIMISFNYMLVYSRK